MTDLLLDAIRSAVRTELDATLAPVLAALKAAGPPARGLSVDEYATQHGVSPWTVRRRVADRTLPHQRIGRRIIIPADAMPTTAGDDRIDELAARARAGR